LPAAKPLSEHLTIDAGDLSKKRAKAAILLAEGIRKIPRITSRGHHKLPAAWNHASHESATTFVNKKMKTIQKLRSSQW
jgi:hypothetical protein